MAKIKLKPIAEQIVVVTGASSGIGLATARLAARRGAGVVLVSRDGDALQRIATAIEADGGRADWAVADVGDAGQVEAAATHAVERFGRIDGWVNDAGVAIYAKLVDTPADEHERMFRTNYWGVVNGSLAAVRHLRDRGGAIVNLGSIGSDSPSPILSAYSATKAAVARYTRALQEELGIDDLPIAVTLVRPSGVATPLAEHAAVHADGGAQLPPYPYDPSVVARAIVDALEHDRGEMIVGGSGRLIVPLSQLFPGLRRWLAGPLARTFVDRTMPPDHARNLYQSLDGGDEQGSEPPARATSISTAVARHSWLSGGAALACMALAVSALATKRKRAARRS